MLPNLSDYMQAFQHPNYILSDRELASCQCPQDQQGQPIVQSGGFALTFQLKGTSKRWAVRCFHREVKDRDSRYSAISAKLNEPTIKQSGYFVDFAYQATGVTVKGQKYPIVKMSWANGVTLGSFLESNYNNPQKLRNLQDSLKRLYKFLVSNHIAHGDIQPGNLMVSADGRNVQLIDYDGMFVSGMESLKAAETGVPNFQHPRRQQESPWNDRLDRFPFIMLDIALAVLAEKPQYWTKTNSSDEKVLFETTDYLAPYGSQIFNDLKADARFSKQTSVLQQICSSDFDSIPPADNYLLFTPSATTVKRAQQPQFIEVSYRGNYTVLDATDVSAIGYHVGDVVEIVGQVVETKDGLTRGIGRRGNRPYMFINFSRWKPYASCFRLVLWSEVLSKFTTMGIPSVSTRLNWQYVSVTGMIIKYNQNTCQLVPTSPTQIQIIDKSEADFRLGRTKKKLKQSFGGTVPANVSSSPTPKTSNTSNAAKLRTMSGGNLTPSPNKTVTLRRPVTPIATVPSPNTPTTNASKLKSLQNQWNGTTKTGSTKTTTSVPTTHPGSKGIGSTSAGGKSTGGSGTIGKGNTDSGVGCFIWAIVIIVGIILINKYGR